MSNPGYEVGNYEWLDEMVSEALGRCPMCAAPMTWHIFGGPLTVCPKCFPDEAAR